MIRDRADGLTEVLVGGRKPEDIEQEFLQKKSKADARLKEEADRRTAAHRSRNDRRRDAVRAEIRSSRRAPFHIQEFKDFYRIGPRRDGDELVTYDLGKELLFGGKKEDQSGWLKLDYAAQCEEIPPVEFIGTAEMYMSIFGILYDNRNHRQYKGMVEHVRAGLEDILTQTSIMTLTSVVYTDKDDEADRVVLAGGDQGVFPWGNLAGRSGPLSSLNDAYRSCVHLLRKGDRRIQEIGLWLTKNSVFLSRHPGNPIDELTIPVSLGMIEYNGQSYFHIDSCSDKPLPALGIRVDIQEAPEARR